MAGKRGRSGKRPQSDDVKLAAGTYRPDKSGSLREKPDLAGKIVPPELRNPVALDMWEAQVQQLIDATIIKPTDVPMALSMCQLWGLYCECYEAARLDPIDKDTRIALCSYWTKFEQAAARFGMNPSDRSRLRLDKPPEGVRGRRA